MEQSKKEAIRRQLEQEKIEILNELRKTRELKRWHQEQMTKLIEKEDDIWNEYNSILPEITYEELRTIE